MPIFTDAQAIDAYWQGEYEFFRKIITDEVDRLRWNDGLEPVEVDLYPVTRKNRPHDPDYVGVLRIGHNKFKAFARYAIDKDGAKILKFQIQALK